MGYESVIRFSQNSCIEETVRLIIVSFSQSNNATNEMLQTKYARRSLDTIEIMFN